MPWSPLTTPDGPGRPRPGALSDGLNRVLASLGAPPTDVFTTVLANWSELVGPAAAEALEPTSIEHGKLVAVTSSSAWASQGRWLEATLITKVGELVGDGVVTGLTVRMIRPPR